MLKLTIRQFSRGKVFPLKIYKKCFNIYNTYVNNTLWEITIRRTLKYIYILSSRNSFYSDQHKLKTKFLNYICIISNALVMRFDNYKK